DEERLVSSSQDLHVYWVHVHANRMHLLGELEQSQLAQSMLAMQMDLSDLTLQVNSQVGPSGQCPLEPEGVSPSKRVEVKTQRYCIVILSRLFKNALLKSNIRFQVFLRFVRS
ncbi:UNVERIFIED_CONTAM: hypothetical protein FKN15_042965, partial [Acipenser sinensis]